MRGVINMVSFLPMVYLVMMPLYLSHSTGLVACAGINVIVADSSEHSFVTRDDVAGLFGEVAAEIAGRPVGSADLSSIKAKLALLPEIRRGEVYRTIDGKINVMVRQRMPVVRIVSPGGESYYIDKEGVLLKKRGVSSPRVHIVTGNTGLNLDSFDGKNITEHEESALLADIYTLVSYIRSDPFLNALIDQIEVDRRGDLQLIPRVAGQRILFGGIENYRDKLANLDAFYEQVLPVAGWDIYPVIDVRFEGQVTARRR